MAVITDIQPQKNNKSRVSIFVDGEFFCGLDIFTQMKHRLKIDAEVDAETLKEAVFCGECESAFTKAASLVSIRLRTEAEIIKALKEKQYSDEVIEKTVEKLKSYGYIDDKAFVKLYISSHLKSWGRKKIEYGLRQIGVNAEILEEELSSFPSQTEETKALIGKFIGSKTLDDKLKSRLYAHLFSKGFSGETVREALNEFLEEREND